MTIRAVLVTLALTAAAVMLIVMKPGLGGRESAVWFLPAALTIAVPAGAFGGILLTRAGRQGSIDEHWVDETARVALLALLLTTVTVGWLVPLACRQTDRSMRRLQADIHQVEVREGTASRLTLDQLFVQADSAPGATQELLRRAAWIAASFLLPLIAGVLTKLKSSWTRSEAALAAAMVFMISVRLGTGT